MATLTLHPRRIARNLAVIALLLAVLSVAGQVVRYRATNETVRSLALLFKLSAEQTIPAYFSSVLLLASAGLLWVIGRSTRQLRRPFATHWTALAAIFAYLSVDEAVGIHELAIDPARAALGSHAVGFLYYAWVIPAAVIVCLIGLAYLRFVLHLPWTVRVRVIGAAMLYGGGALGMETVGGYFASTIGTSSIRYALSALIEETMEMLGVVLFIHALLTHLACEAGEVRFALTESPAEPFTPKASRAPLNSMEFTAPGSYPRVAECSKAQVLPPA